MSLSTHPFFYQTGRICSEPISNKFSFKTSCLVKLVFIANLMKIFVYITGFYSMSIISTVDMSIGYSLTCKKENKTKNSVIKLIFFVYCTLDKNKLRVSLNFRDVLYIVSMHYRLPQNHASLMNGPFGYRYLSIICSAFTSPSSQQQESYQVPTQPTNIISPSASEQQTGKWFQIEQQT